MSFRIRNLGAKLLAFVLALVVYVHVVTEKEQEAEIDIPLRVTDLPEGLVLEAGAPEVARVTVRGKAKALPVLRVKSPEMVVTLADARPGQVQRMLSPADVVLPMGVSVDITEVMEPRRATFSVDTLVVSPVPVRVRTRGDLPAGLCLAESLAASPAVVQVTGPSRKLAGLRVVDTWPLDLGRAGRGAFDLRLDAGAAFRCAPPSVRVEPVTAPRATRRVSGVPVRLEDGVAGKAVPETGDVVLEGPQAVLDSLDTGTLGIRLPGASLSIGRHFLAPEVDPPHPLVRVAGVEPTRFVVEIGEARP